MFRKKLKISLLSTDELFTAKVCHDRMILERAMQIIVTTGNAGNTCFHEYNNGPLLNI